MDKFILGCIVISYSILITIQISMSKELLKIKKILWKVAKNESLELAFKKTKQKSTYPKECYLLSKDNEEGQKCNI